MISFEQIAFLFKIPNDFGLNDRLSDGEPIHPPSKSSSAALTVAKHQVDWSGCTAREKLARSVRRLLRFTTAEKWANALGLHYYGGPCHAEEIKNALPSRCNMKLNTPRLGAVKTLQLVSVNPPADQWEPRLPPECWTRSAFCAVLCLLKSFSVCEALWSYHPLSVQHLAASRPEREVRLHQIATMRHIHKFLVITVWMVML